MRVGFGQLFKISEVPFTFYTSPEVVSLKLQNDLWALVLKDTVQCIESPQILRVSTMNAKSVVYAEQFGHAIGIEGTLFETQPFCPDWIVL